MISRTARLPGFHRLPRDSRLAALVETGWLSPEEAEQLQAPGCTGGFGVSHAEAMSENVIGVHGLPVGLCLNLRVDGSDRVAPMVIEEPSVVAAASNAARLVRTGGGFTTELTEPIMAAQIQVTDLPDALAAAERLRTNAPGLLRRADGLIPRMVARGGGARELLVRVLPAEAPLETESSLVVHVLVDCRDAMGANLLNTVAEGLAPDIGAITGGRIGLRILTNLADRRRVRVQAQVPFEALSGGSWSGEEVARRIAAASRFADVDPYRAVTHNKGIMNGLDAVLLATGQDWRQAEAAAHAWAGRQGTYRPLSGWRVGQGGLEGTLELPLAVGTVGGAARAHPGVRELIRIAGVESAGDLARLAASVGLASNLAALKALGTDGIQQGHMALHARSVALEAGAPEALVEVVAARLTAERSYRPERAREILAGLENVHALDRTCTPPVS